MTSTTDSVNKKQASDSDTSSVTGDNDWRCLLEMASTSEGSDTCGTDERED